jgi:hypothetical protein
MLSRQESGVEARQNPKNADRTRRKEAMRKAITILLLVVAAAGCASTSYKILDGRLIVKVYDPPFGYEETLEGTLSPLEEILYRAWLECTRNSPAEEAERKCGQLGYVLGRDVKLPAQIVAPPASPPPASEPSQSQVVVVCGTEREAMKTTSSRSGPKKNVPTCEEKLKALEAQLQAPAKPPIAPKTE